MNQIKIALVGDVFFQGPIINAQNSRVLFNDLEDTDLIIANLEAPITQHGYPFAKRVALRCPHGTAKEIRKIGIKFVSLANNHMLDYGVVGLNDTIKSLNEEGIQFCGAGENVENAFAYTMLNVKGLKIALLSFSCVVPPSYSATDLRPGIAAIRIVQDYAIDGITAEELPGISPYVRTRVYEPDLKVAISAIISAKANSDIVLVLIHWGVPIGYVAPFQWPLADYQVPLSRSLLKAGADAIIGHHPHCLHGIEIVNSRPIFYSLGEFIWHPYNINEVIAGQHIRLPYKPSALNPPERKESAIAYLEIEDKQITGKMRPIILNSTGEPEYAKGCQAQSIIQRVLGFCKELNWVPQADDKFIMIK